MSPIVLEPPLMHQHHLDLPQRCVACGTTDTPLWRRDPVSGSAMCNSCGEFSCLIYFSVRRASRVSAFFVRRLSNHYQMRCFEGPFHIGMMMDGLVMDTLQRVGIRSRPIWCTPISRRLYLPTFCLIWQRRRFA
ncbi:hypothetical protein BDZ89DRAFT_583933 [Hymenopellis radicata]|nr:hypothetical protein BDZ89DRAFT_583933 [Hymenopellis radicata]